MGKYMRKNKRIGDIAVMEVAHVGVRTRSRALDMGHMAAAASSETAKRRKVGGGEVKISSTSLIQLGSTTPITHENSLSPAISATVSNDDKFSGSISDLVPASCYSSNASSNLEKESLKIVDLEDVSVQIETSTCNFDPRGRRETTPSSELEAESDNLESTAKPTEADYRRRSSAVTMPSETELDEFFDAAEKDLVKRFTEKYNFDIVKDVPLEGRYEWVPLKP
ncbi:hypothetical protein U1Q18_011857 [Sarracenia purpurea var. burkii]